jgi:hypothetical protein
VIGSRPSYWEQWSSVIGFWTCESPGGDCPCSRDTRVPGTGVMELDPGKLRCRRYPMVARPSHLRPSDSATLRFGIWGMWAFISVLTLFWIPMPLAPQPPVEFSDNQLGITLLLYVALIALAMGPIRIGQAGLNCSARRSWRRAIAMGDTVARVCCSRRTNCPLALGKADPHFELYGSRPHSYDECRRNFAESAIP